MNELKYYKGILNKIKKEFVNVISVQSSIKKGLMCAFFVATNGQIKCRSPPFINLFKKNSN